MSSPTLLLSLLLLLAAAAPLTLSTSWEDERLNWLTVTKPNAANVALNCRSLYLYPFTLLNDTDNVGEGRIIASVEWILPDETKVGVGYDDGNRRVVSNGVEMTIAEANDKANGLYHCCVTHSNGTVYYYKRGLNLYGPDLYQGDQWKKYSGNLLSGFLSAGSFLALLGGFVLLKRFAFGEKSKVTVEPLGESEDTEAKAEAETAA